MRALRLLALTLAAGAFAGTAAATIVSTSGQVQKIAPPPSVRIGALESDLFMRAFDERQCVTLSQNLPVNITRPGTYDDTSDLTPGAIPKGTSVSSHFVHADSATGTKDVARFFTGSIVTDEDVLGIAILTNALNATDVLGAPGTLYPKDLRKLNLDKQSDSIVLDADRRTVRISVENHTHADQVRVITKCTPKERGEGCTPGFWKQPQHFDSWTKYSTNDLYDVVFGVVRFPGKTLLDALNFKGNSGNSLARHSVAALLNSTSPDVDYDLTESQVIQMTRDAWNSNDPKQWEQTKRTFERFNEQRCPLS